MDDGTEAVPPRGPPERPATRYRPAGIGCSAATPVTRSIGLRAVVGVSLAVGQRNATPRARRLRRRRPIPRGLRRRLSRGRGEAHPARS